MLEKILLVLTVLRMILTIFEFFERRFASRKGKCPRPKRKG